MSSHLSPGTKLGRYEIRSMIGEGGMGEVYLARDFRLNRDVAIKVLFTMSPRMDSGFWSIPGRMRNLYQ